MQIYVTSQFWEKQTNTKKNITRESDSPSPPSSYQPLRLFSFLCGGGELCVCTYCTFFCPNPNEGWTIATDGEGRINRVHVSYLRICVCDHLFCSLFICICDQLFLYVSLLFGRGCGCDPFFVLMFLFLCLLIYVCDYFFFWFCVFCVCNYHFLC